MKPTKRAKAVLSKSKGIKKGKSLEAVKPLVKVAAPVTTTPTESISLPYSHIEVKYSN